jgi:hypothetical protein
MKRHRTLCHSRALGLRAVDQSIAVQGRCHQRQQQRTTEHGQQNGRLGEQKGADEKDGSTCNKQSSTQSLCLLPDDGFPSQGRRIPAKPFRCILGMMFPSRMNMTPKAALIMRTMMSG